MHEAVLADVQVARARAAAPRVGVAVGEIVLEAPDPRVEILQDLARTVDRRRHVVVHLALDRTERLQPAGAVVDDAD